MQYVKCTKKLPGHLSPDRQQEQIPTIDPILVHGKTDLVAKIQLTRAHGSTLTPRQGSTKEWKTQTKEDFIPRPVEVPSKQLQQERTNIMREAAYLPLRERTAIPFSQPETDVHSRAAFPRYGPESYHIERRDRVAAHPSNSNVVLDADKDPQQDVKNRSTSTMHDQFKVPNVQVVGKLKTKDQRGENQQELMKSNWTYGEPEAQVIGEDGKPKAVRSLAHCKSVAKEPLPTRDAKLLSRLPGDGTKPEDIQLPTKTFLEGQSGREAKFFSRVPFQSGCNLSNSTNSPSLLDRPGAGTTTQASYPRYVSAGADGGLKATAKARAGAENMGHQMKLPDGRTQYLPSSVQIGDFEKTSYVTSQKAQFRGVWFDDATAKK